MSDRQAEETSHASFLQLNINTSEGLESLNVVFDTPERRGEWEEAFTKAKEKLEVSEILSQKKTNNREQFL